MRKVLALILGGALILAMAGCKDDAPATPAGPGGDTAVTEAERKAAAEAAKKKAEEEAAKKAAEEAKKKAPAGSGGK